MYLLYRSIQKIKNFKINFCFASPKIVLVMLREEGLKQRIEEIRELLNKRLQSTMSSLYGG